MRIWSPLSLVLLVLLGASTWTNAALAEATTQASSTRTCAEAASAGQLRRDEGKLIEARAKFVTCAQPHCPKLIQKDCAQWQAEVEERLPTIVLGAKDDAGKDITVVTVTMDGKPFATRIEGRSIPVDPGAHKFHFEAPGHEPADADAVVREGERARTIQGTLKRPPDPNRPLIVEPPMEPTTKSGPGPLPWVLGGIGVVGIGAGAAFFVSGLMEREDLRDTCAKQPGGCTREETSGLRTKQTLDIISFSVGGAALVGAIVLFAVGGSSSSATVKATPTAGGARAEIDFRF